MRETLMYTEEKIGARLKLIQKREVVLQWQLPPFRYAEVDETYRDDKSQPSARLLCSEEHVVQAGCYWGKWNQNFLLKTKFALSEGARAAFEDPALSVELFLPLGVSGDVFNHPEAMVRIDGQIVGSADRHHHFIALPDEVFRSDRPNYELSLHGWTGWPAWPPSNDDTSQLLMGECGVVAIDRATRNFFRTASAVLDQLSSLEPKDLKRGKLRSLLDSAVRLVDTRDLLPDSAFRKSILAASEALQDGIENSGIAVEPCALAAIGHAHIDLAYLWTVAQSKMKAGRTFANVLRLAEANPSYRFSQSMPFLYESVEQEFPQLSKDIDRAVKNGQWEVLSGMWVEADINLSGGESLVRQLMLAQEYTRNRFGDQVTEVLWLPDCFGFVWSLPQLIKQAGLRGLVTSKLTWNQTNNFPHQLFQWQGIDGTRVPTALLVTPRDVAYLPFPASYKAELSAFEIHGTWKAWRQDDDHDELMIAYGYGDGGGGPTQELIDKLEVFASMPAAPQTRAATVSEYFDRLETRGTGHLPVWNDELYLELHRGTYTGEAWLKRANRKAEYALHTVEFLTTLAWLNGHVYPAIGLREAWKTLALNQFHDILPGTAIREVFDDAANDHNHLAQLLGEMRTSALNQLTNGCEAILNATSYQSASVIDDPSGHPSLVKQTCPYSLISPERHKVSGNSEASLGVNDAILQNEHLRVRINYIGELTSVFDLHSNREALQRGQEGNQFWLFEDRPFVWDAWDIEASVEEGAEREVRPATIDVRNFDGLRAEVIVERPLGFASRMKQIIRLDAFSPRVDFITEVDWAERHTLLKVAFPVSVHASSATYDIQFGQIARPTHRNTSWDAAKFEVPGHRWVDMREEGFGVALLNDCKYGFDVHGSLMRQSLLKSATMPNPDADQGKHEFTYSFMCHDGSGFEEVNRQAALLNNPPEWIAGTEANAIEKLNISPLNLEGTGAVVSAIKRSEDGNAVIVRVYQSERRVSHMSCHFNGELGSICGLINEIAEDVDQHRAMEALGPFEIRSLRFQGKCNA